MDTETSWTRNTCLMTDFPEALNRPDLIRLSVLKRSRRCQQRRSFYRNINDTFLWKHDFQGKGLNHKKNMAVKRLPALLLRQKVWNKVCWGFLTLLKSCYTVSWLEQLFCNEDKKKPQHQLAQAQDCSHGTAQWSLQAVTSSCVTLYPSIISSSPKWVSARCLLMAMDGKKINNHISV